MGAHTQLRSAITLFSSAIFVAAASFANERVEDVCKSLDAEYDAKVTRMFQICSVDRELLVLVVGGMARARVMRCQMLGPLFALSFQATQLGWGAQSVIGGGILRSLHQKVVSGTATEITRYQPIIKKEKNHGSRTRKRRC